MKILWASNSPWSHSGYGNQTRLFVPRMAKAGHEIAIAANHGLQGGVPSWLADGHEIPVYPAGLAEYSNDVIPAHALDWFRGDPGLLLTLYDVWALRAMQYRDLNVAAWTPVDHMPTPPAVAKWFRDYGARPIAMSRFGEDQLTKSGLAPLYVPHGVDTDVFVPHPKAEAKAKVGLDPDKFTVGIVAANVGRYPPRKAFAESFAAYALFHADHPDTHLYVHSDIYGHANGVELDVLAGASAIPEDALTFADQYGYRRGVADESMAWLYSAFDVLLAASMGEGFGIPVLEAQACGTPVIVSDFSAQPELVAPDHGYTVQCQPWWDAGQKAFFVLPYIPSIVASLEDAHAHRGTNNRSDPCRDFAVGYDADLVFDEHWVPVLDQLEQLLPSTDPIETKPISMP